MNSDNLTITMFGRFQIQYSDNIIDDTNSRSKKMWLLLEYLIASCGKAVSQTEIIDLLWHDDAIDDPANTLKTLVHRVRQLLSGLGYLDGKSLLCSSRGGYYWNADVPCRIDTEVFEQLYNQASAADIPESEKLSLLLSAIREYKGYFLPKNAMESWVIPISTYYHTIYQKAVLEAVELLTKSADYACIIDICSSFLAIDPYEESIHYELIKALAASGKCQAALNHYEYTTKLFFSEFGVNPSEQLTALYKEISKAVNNTEFDLNIIKGSLREENVAPGAYYCEFELFKEIYQIESRAAARTGQSIFLCLFTLTSSKNEELPQKFLNKTMEKLGTAIRISLRRGDIYTRYSVTQYLVMLPTASFENSEMVAKRIIRRFYTDNPRLAVTIKYTAKPLEPAPL